MRVTRLKSNWQEVNPVGYLQTNGRRAELGTDCDQLVRGQNGIRTRDHSTTLLL